MPTSCAQKMSAIRDRRLQVAADSLRVKFPHLVFPLDDACRPTKVTTKALAATLHRSYP
jgi:hypothetical protein